MSVGALNYGDTAAREISQRFGGYFATQALLQALPADKRSTGMVCMAGSQFYVFDADAAAGGLTPSAGTGRWLASAAPTIRVRGATAAALAANTRTANVLTADANGALGTIDGLTAVVGDLFLIKDESTGANNGVYVVTSLGSGSSRFTFTRAPEMDTTAEVLPGTKIQIAEGTANADRTYTLTTNAPITINSTSLTFTVDANLTDLASTATGKGASLVGIYDTPNKYTATTVEGALAEVKDLADAAAVRATLALTTTPGGASYIGVFDTANKITATTVEAALAEIAADNWVTTARIADANVTAAKLANGAGVAALLTAGLGNSLVVAQDATNPTLLAADAVKDRACLVVAVVTETLAGTAAFVVESVGGTTLLTIEAGTAGDVLVGAGIVEAHESDSLIRVHATSGDTGAVSVTILALPTA